MVEAAAGTGKTTELVARIVALVRARARRARPHRRGHLHREGRGRDEAAPARRAGGARDAGGHARGAAAAHRGPRAARGGAHRHHPLASAPTSCASGRSRRASTRSSRWRRARTPSASSTRPSTAGSRRSSPAAARGRAARPAAQACGAATRRRASSCATPAWELIEHRDFDGAWRRDSFDRDAAMARMLDKLAELGALHERAADSDDWAAKSLGEVAPLRRRAAPPRGRPRRATTTASRPSCRALARRKIGAGAGAASAYARGAGAGRGARAARRGQAGARRVRGRLRRRPGRLPARRAAAARATPTRTRRRAPASSTSSTCSSGRATSCATTRGPRGASAALHAHLRRRVPGHRPAAGRDPAPPRRRRPRRGRLAPRPARARQALRRRRSQAVDLPLPPRRHRALRGGQGALLVAPARELLHLTTSFRSRARHPAGGERRVRAAHAGRRTQARYVPLDPVAPADVRPARGGGAAGPAPLRRVGQGHQGAHRRVVCPTRWARSSSGS